ncbi:MAG: recombinase family protein [Clostridiales Family XIII bacterium]|jgi:hypothetical protein|nr:recombinase family protein [Clostridiales Family XIII bacterium]
MNNKRKTAIYCRTAIADDGKIASQEARLRAYADEHGYTDIVCHSDNGAAGNTRERPAMNALTADIEIGKIGTVLATDVSRIARTYSLYSEWCGLIGKLGVVFVTLTDDDRPTATADLTYRLAGDYLLPNLALSNPPDAPPLGCCGMRHKAYLREEKPALYSELLLTERLYPLCREIDEAAANRRALGMSEGAIIRELVCC